MIDSENEQPTTAAALNVNPYNSNKRSYIQTQPPTKTKSIPTIFVLENSCALVKKKIVNTKSSESIKKMKEENQKVGTREE